MVLEVPQLLLIFLKSCFFILFWLNVYFFLLFQIVDLRPSFLPCNVGSLYIFLYFILYSLHFFLYFAVILNHFCEHPDSNVMNSASLLVAQFFFTSFDLFFHLGHISWSWCSCYVVRGRALGIRQGGITHFPVSWCCMWGRGLRGNSAACQLAWLSPNFLSLPLIPTSGLCPFRC